MKNRKNLGKNGVRDGNVGGGYQASSNSEEKYHLFSQDVTTDLFLNETIHQLHTSDFNGQSFEPNAHAYL